jgi:hypothetical protein
VLEREAKLEGKIKLNETRVKMQKDRDITYNAILNLQGPYMPFLHTQDIVRE